MPPSYSWLKLYYEILDDPKMGRLSDKLWRRSVESFLLAGRHGNSGSLPSVAEMAWTLRITPEALELELTELASITQIVELINGVWHVRKFVERQAAIPASERMLQMRTRKRYDDVTRRHTEEEEEEEVDIEVEEEVVAAVVKLYENNLSLMTPILKEELIDAISEFTAEWVSEAIKETAKNGARSFKYTRAILARWKKDGYKIDNRPSKKNGLKTEPKKYNPNPNNLPQAQLDALKAEIHSKKAIP